jgi:nitroreductase
MGNEVICMALFSFLEPSQTAILLPASAKTNDCSVFTALERRRTIRDISSAKLPLQIVSNLLWAAFGINRKAGPFGVSGRTAASASNSQEIDVYVAMEEGAYKYDAEQHCLLPVIAQDLRQAGLTPGQHSIDAQAPITLIYVVDMNRLEYSRGYKEPGLKDPEIQKSYYYVDTGLIAGNVYIYAATEGLAAWFHNCDRDKLAAKLALRPEQHVLFAQSIGYPDGA